MADAPKPIRMTAHALEQCELRGTTPAEVEVAIRNGIPEPAEKGRWMYRYNVEFDDTWYGNRYEVKQVAPIVVEEQEQFVVVTVLTFYF